MVSASKVAAALCGLALAAGQGCANMESHPMGTWVVYNLTSETRPGPAESCKGFSFGDKVPDDCCTGLGTFNMLEKTWAQFYKGQGNNKCPVLMPGMNALIQCMADDTVSYGEDCDSSCDCEHKMTVGPGCYKASDMPGTMWFVSAMGCQCKGEASGAALTCKDVKDAYTESSCCGLPDKAFDASKLCSQAEAAKPSGFRPNMLLIVWDGWRWDFDGLHPDIDYRGTVVKKVAEKGVRFDKAYSPAPVCGPSRNTWSVGRDYDFSPVMRNGQEAPHDMDTYFERLQDVGYFTLMTGKDHLRMVSGIGLDGKRGEVELGWDAATGTVDTWEFAKEEGPQDPYGFWLHNNGVYDEMVEEYGTYPFTTKQSSLCYNQEYLDDVFIGLTYWCPNRSNFADNWRIDKFNLQIGKELFGKYYLASPEARKKPWMWWVNFMGGHPPFIMTTEGWSSTANRVFKEPLNSPTFNAKPEIASFLPRAYAALLEDNDMLTHDLMDWLDENSPGGLDNIVVMVTGDHGEMIGDYQRTGKSSHHEASSRVPLAISGPGITMRNRVIKTPVSVLDTVGTMLEIAGATLADGMTAQSLMPLINGGLPSRTIVTSGLTMGSKDIRMRWKQYNNSHTLKFICCVGGCPESTMLPVTTENQAALMMVTDLGDGDNVLAVGRTEALELLGTMTQKYQDACSPLI